MEVDAFPDSRLPALTNGDKDHWWEIRTFVNAWRNAALDEWRWGGGGVVDVVQSNQTPLKNNPVEEEEEEGYE